MATWRYIVTDLRTDATFAELALAGVEFSWVLNGAGTFKASLPYRQFAATSASVTALQTALVRSATEPARTALYVERDGTLLWGGIIWARRPAPAAKTLEIVGAEFWSYFQRRHITTALSYTGVDQFHIAQDLIDYAQGKQVDYADGGVATYPKPGGDISVAVASTASGITRDRSWGKNERKEIGEAVEQLASLIDGFDFAVEVTYDAGVRTRTFATYYPRRGSAYPASGLVFELGRNIVAYDWPEDGTRFATAMLTSGAGENDAMIASSATATDLIDAGYPLIEATTVYKDVTEQATLDGHAAGDLAARSSMPGPPSITVRGDVDPVLGSWRVGDQCQIRIDDEWMPEYVGIHRIIAATVKPGDGGQEEVSLALEPI